MTARVTGKRVRVTGATTETSLVTANPNGTVTVESAVEPQRARQADGRWKDVDLGLVAGADGRVRPAVSVADVRFSGGGTGPLVELVRDGKSLTMSLPGVLPAPVIAGATATYREVLPGADLVVRATRTGFTHLWVIKNAKAAANPALRQMRFDLGGDATVTRHADGSLQAKVGASLMAWSRPASMWDSTVPRVQPGTREGLLPSGHMTSQAVKAVGAGLSTADGPGDGARVAAVATRVTSAGDLLLTPDLGLLDAAAVSYPIFVDPSWSVSASSWAYATSNDESNDTTSARVGLNSATGALYRSFFQFSTTSGSVSLKGKQILSATVRMNLDDSSSCTDTPTSLYRTPAINAAPKASWSSMSLSLYLAVAQSHAASSCSQPDQLVDFTSAALTADMQAAAAANWDTYTVGLCACDSSGLNEGTQDRWKKFYTNGGTLLVTYNSYPTTGTQSTTPSTACATGSARPFLNTVTPTLAAVVSDAEGSTVKAEFEWWAVGGPAKIGSLVTATAASGSTLQATVPSGAFTGGNNYMWRVRGNDGTVDGAWSPWCEFTIDTAAPAAPSVTSTSHPSQTAWYQATTFTGTVSASDSSGLNGYAVIVDSSPSTSAGTTVTQTGTAVSLTAQPEGVRYVHVAALDKAGNWSATTHYTFQVDATKPGAVPGLASSTHPVSTNTYPTATITASWSAPSDLAGIAEYAITVDQAATTLPATTDTRQPGTSVTRTVSGDGVWYLHVRAKDNAGNWSDSAGHFTFQVATGAAAGPVVASSSHPNQSAAYPSGAFTGSWTPPAGGATGYAVVLDQIAATVPAETVTTTGTTHTATVADGVWYLHVRAKDTAGLWSNTTTFRFTVDTAAPVAPAVSSTDLPAGLWADRANLASTVRLDPVTSTDVTQFRYSLDGGAAVTVPAVTGQPLDLDLVVTTNGPHTLSVQSVDLAGNMSPATSYFFMIGPSAGDLVEPVHGAIIPARTILRGGGHESTSGLQFEWRRADTDTWATVPAGDVTLAEGGGAVTWPLATTGGGAYPYLNWDVARTINDAEAGPDPLDGPLQVRAVFTGTGYGPSTPAKITFDRNRGTAASAQVGPGSVNLLTGNYTLSGADVAVGGLGVSRVYNTRQAGGVDPLFGPGWISSALVAEGSSPYTKLEVFDALVQLGMPDGTVAGFTPTGTGTTFEQPNSVSDVTITLNRGPSIPSADDDTYTVTDTAGNQVVFTRAVGDPAGQFHPVSVVAAGSGDTTTVSWEKMNVGGTDVVRPTRILAPAPAGVSCTTLVRGCRAVTFTYAGATTATSTVWGDYAGRISAISYTAYDPQLAGMVTVEVARYGFDDTGRLRTSWDPRLDWVDQGIQHLNTYYTYNTDGILATLTPPGQLPWQFAYTTLPGDSGKGRLHTVTRSALSAGTATTTVVYRVPISGSGAPYDMSPSETGRWAQIDALTDATAIFPATQIPDGNQATGTLPTSYERATVTYLDANARAVNNAAPGGYIDTTWYDRWGNVTDELTPGNRKRALDGGGSAYAQSLRAETLSTRSFYTSDGRRVRDTLGPEHDVQLTNGTLVRGRSHTVYTYDENAPDPNVDYDLVTTEVTDVSHWVGGVQAFTDARTTKTEYDWTKKLPIKTIVDPSGLALTTRYSYDSLGRIVSQTTPGGGTSDTTPSTRITIYYTNAPNATYPDCGGHPEWEGQVCVTNTGGQAASGPELPVTRTTYALYGQPWQSFESTSAGTLRTTTISYDQASRPVDASIEAPGLGQALEVRRSVYDQATGQNTRKQTRNGSTVTAEIVRVFDTLGRQTSYTDADAANSTATYDILGRPAVVVDGRGSRTYTYDGGTERRGLPTSVVDTHAGTFSGTYDADGNLTTQTWGNGITVTVTVDESGAAAALVYAKPGCGQGDCTLYSESAKSSVHGQRLQRTSTLSSQDHAYDKTGRLTQVKDTLGGSCTTRVYTFDAATNRNGLTTYNPGTGGACQTTTSSASTTWTFDTADRVTTSGYTYDALGRTLTMPGADTAVPAGGQETLSYHTNDMARTIAQGNKTNTYTLDVSSSRFRSWTETTGSTTITKKHHYADDSDNPNWTDEGGGNTSWAFAGLGGIAGIYTSGTGDVWQITNLHGDLVAGITGGSYGLAYTSEFTESGLPRNSADAGERRYGWLGAAQRAADTPGGLTLMGVRLYSSGTGRFVQEDPIEMGSCSRYDYACGDPLGSADITGTTKVVWHWWGYEKQFNKSETDDTAYWLHDFPQDMQLWFGIPVAATIQRIWSKGWISFLTGPIGGIIYLTTAALIAIGSSANRYRSQGKCISFKMPWHTWGSYSGGYCR